MENEIIKRQSDEITKNPYIQQPGDMMIQEMKPYGDIITKLDTKERKATHRQYTKKDGTPGKQVVIVMQPDK